MKRLLSLNLVLVMLLGMIPTAALAAEVAEIADEHGFEKYIIIDGVEYDATTENLSGEGWEYECYTTGQDPCLKLMDYSSGEIETNISLVIYSFGENSIVSTGGYGIYSTGDLTFLFESVDNTTQGTLSVYGAQGYAAIFAASSVEIRSGYLTLVGGGVSALLAESIVYDLYWPYVLKVGETAETAVQAEYTMQKYFSIELIPYVMTLHGNGGTTKSGEEIHKVICTSGTRGWMFLYPLKEVFSAEDEKILTGWNESADGLGKIYSLEEAYEFECDTYDATLYALWEDDVHKAITLHNYFGICQAGSFVYTGETRVIHITAGSEYILPDQSRKGKVFDGWRGTDGILYPAGMSVSIDESMEFTAEFSTLKFTVGGVEYPVDQQSSVTNKWIYYKDRAQLWIYVGYDSGPISFPCDVNINLLSSVIGTEGKPAIYVDGNANVIVHDRDAGDHPVVLTGGDGAPAIDCTGTLTLTNTGYYAGENILVLQGGSSDEPALRAEAVCFDECITYADANCTNKVKEYSNEHYLKLVKKVSAEAVGPETIEGTNLTWELSEEGVLTISGDGAMIIGYGNAPWYNKRDSIVSLIIEDGVTSIGDYAFYQCGGLSSVIIPDSVTAIGDFAFSSCKLTSITIPDSVTTLGDCIFQGCTKLLSVKLSENSTTIGPNMFSNCTSLTSISIPANVTTMGYRPFSGCTALEEFIVADGNQKYCVVDGVLFSKNLAKLVYYPAGKKGISYAIPAGTTSIGDSAFIFCKSLSSVTIPDSVTYVGACVFLECEALTEVNISKNMTTIGNYMFADCGSLTSVSIPENITSIGTAAFYGAGLTSVVIPESVSSIGQWAFEDCENLSSVVMPEGILSIGEAAFKNCTTLEGVTIPASVITVGDCVFEGCSALTDIYVENANPNYRAVDGVLFSKDMTSLICYPINKTETSYNIPDGVISIERSAFAYCDKLDSVIIPSCVTSIDTAAFLDCDALASMSIPDSVVSLGWGAFMDCSCLAEVQLSQNITTIESSTFWGCSSLTSIIIPEGITVLSSHAFYQCSNLTEVTISKTVATIERSAFYYCNKLNAVTFEGNAPIIGANVFRTCTANCYYPANNTTWTDIVSANEQYGGSLTWIPVYETDNSSYTLTLYGNGGTTESGEKTYQIYMTNGTPGYITLYLYADVFQNGDRELLSWNESADGSGMGYSLNGEYWFESGDYEASLYAIWSAAVLTRATVCTKIVEAMGWEYSSDMIVPFTDVSTEDEDYEAIAILYDRGIMGGVSETTFYPSQSITRAQLATILCRTLEWTVEVTEPLPNDVPSSHGYAASVCTTLGRGLMSLDENGNFNPNNVAMESDADFSLLPELNIKAGTCGENLSWTLEDGLLTVSGEGEMYGYTYAKPAPWNDYSSNITGVVIEEGVTSVGNYAFNGCTALTSVTMPNTVTDICFRAFYGCSALESITIPNSVTFLSSGAFGHCTALETIVIADGNANYKNANDVVFTIDGRTLYIVPAGFEGKFIVPEGTTKIGGYAFWGCIGLNAVQIPQSVANIGACAFSGCSGLKAIEIPTGVQAINSNIFYACGLRSVTIPSGVVQIGEYAFGKCTLLETVYFEGNAPTIKDDAFQNVTATAYYLDSDTWTTTVMQNYGGTIVWVANKTAESAYPNSGGAAVEDNAFTANVTEDERAAVVSAVSGVVVDQISVTETLTTEEKNAAIELTGSNNPLVEYKTYLDVVLKEYHRGDSSAGAVMVLDITPMAIATVTVNGEAVEIGDARKLDVVGTPVVVTIPLPEAFVKGAGYPSYLYVIHDKNDASKPITHCVTVQSNAEIGYYVSFTNTEGFSTFTVTDQVATVTDSEGNVTSFTNLDSAIRAAASYENGGTVALMLDQTAGDLLVRAGVTLDLNGYTLTADYVVGFNSSNVVDNSADKTGLLKCSNVYLTKNNEQMPIWNAVDGYVFAEMKDQSRYTLTDDGFVLNFRPRFQESKNFDINYFATGASDNAVEIAVRLSWTTEDGDTDYRYFVYGDTMVGKTYAQSKTFKFTATGTADIENLVVEIVISSDTGTIWTVKK